jgi:hypothetical protein
MAGRARKGEETELIDYRLNLEGHEIARDIYCMLPIR